MQNKYAMKTRNVNEVVATTTHSRLTAWTSMMLLGLVLLTLLSYSNAVFAHASLVKAEPARRAMLSTSPKQVRLWFNEEIEPAFASLTVLDAEANPMTAEKPLVHPEDPKSIFVELPELAPGQYTVKFRVLSVDGHVVDSDYKFTVKNKK
ncbi:copper resistance CopC family protein [Nitrosomonas sp. ANs5]|uniref:copper resistance CopC family protein n=1 Tax=Nitrosomonas sp. ANs5 TaxID=3423941 RepID=UPI003D33249A